MRALAHAVWGDEPTSDCTRCVRDPGLRVDLGCDAPAPTPLLRLVCGACFGREPKCLVCKGAGKTDWRRCARRMAEAEEPRVGQVFRLFQQYEAHGVLPGPGGFADMPSSLACAFEIIASEKARIENQRAEAQMRDQRDESRSAARKARGGALR